MSEIDPQTLNEIRHIQMLLGRNVLVFQNVEKLLKLIHSFRQASGTAENLIKRKYKIDELSLGRLSDQTVLSKIDSKLSKRNDNEFHFEFDLLPNYEPLESAIRFFNEINQDRNILIHNFIDKWPLDSSVKREQAKNWLLNQYEAIIDQREILVSTLKLIVERSNIVSDYISSEEGQINWQKFLATDEESITFSFSEKD